MNTCGWRALNCRLETVTSAVLFRSATSPPLRRPEGTAGTPHTFIDHGRQTSGSRWHQGRRRRQPVDEAAAPGHQSFPATCAQSFCIGSVPVRVLVVVSRQTPPSSGCRSYQAVDAFATSRLAQEAKVSTAVFNRSQSETWSQGTIARTHPGHRCNEAAQPTVRMPSNRTTDQEGIRCRHQ